MRIFISLRPVVLSIHESLLLLDSRSSQRRIRWLSESTHMLVAETRIAFTVTLILDTRLPDKLQLFGHVGVDQCSDLLCLVMRGCIPDLHLSDQAFPVI